MVYGLAELTEQPLKRSNVQLCTQDFAETNGFKTLNLFNIYLLPQTLQLVTGLY